MSHPDSLLSGALTEDALGEALHLLRLNGALYCRAELSAPWGLTLPPIPGCLWFHVVTTGSGWIETPDSRPRQIRPGEFVLIPQGTGHRLRSDPEAPAPDILALDREKVGERYEILRHGGGGTATTLVCGAVGLDHPAARNLLRHLPDLLHLDTLDAHSSDWMDSTLRLMATEARRPRPGGEAVITRLADILVIQAIRYWIEKDSNAQNGWVGAFRDEQVGRALALMHRNPEHPWTLASLASAVAMSRSAFAARFATMVGEPAMQYLATWRMQVAHDMLEREDATIAEIASRLGYRSEAAFARAFKRVTGTSPGAVRRAEPVVQPVRTSGGVKDTDHQGPDRTRDQ